jgi:hypothetical protein
MTKRALRGRSAAVPVPVRIRRLEHDDSRGSVCLRWPVSKSDKREAGERQELLLCGEIAMDTMEPGGIIRTKVRTQKPK